LFVPGVRAIDGSHGEQFDDAQDFAIDMRYERSGHA
jgi:hypothetical protein